MPVFLADQAATDIALVEVTRVSTVSMAEPLTGWRDTIEFRTVEVLKGIPPTRVTRVWGRPDATPDCPFQERAPVVGERYAAWFKAGFSDSVLDVKRLVDVQREAPSWPADLPPTPSPPAQSEN
ncbi:hypothetical protein [Brevundimonas sp. Leaf280]|uniref:hypothetical protein n=1 Tax=Brevundimonas sp. Leaf280 TaxID=1736320 RepID=UPI0012E24B57|nr:hypothetical protein [Brevundimonas sp. Leaf280]